MKWDDLWKWLDFLVVFVLGAVIGALALKLSHG